MDDHIRHARTGKGRRGRLGIIFEDTFAVSWRHPRFSDWVASIFLVPSETTENPNDPDWCRRFFYVLGQYPRPVLTQYDGGLVAHRLNAETI